jgi:hypothetical protein
MKVGDDFAYLGIERRMRLKQILTDGLSFAQDRHRWRAEMRKTTNLRVP